jgi:hypothetical protein
MVPVHREFEDAEDFLPPLGITTGFNRNFDRTSRQYRRHAGRRSPQMATTEFSPRLSPDPPSRHHRCAHRLPGGTLDGISGLHCPCPLGHSVCCVASVARSAALCTGHHLPNQCACPVCVADGGAERTAHTIWLVVVPIRYCSPP